MCGCPNLGSSTALSDAPETRHPAELRITGPGVRRRVVAAIHVPCLMLLPPCTTFNLIERTFGTLRQAPGIRQYCRVAPYVPSVPRPPPGRGTHDAALLTLRVRPMLNHLTPWLWPLVAASE